MDDLTITKLCAEAMGYGKYDEGRGLFGGPGLGWNAYSPLHDDAQAMALVKKLSLTVHRHNEGQNLIWIVGGFGYYRDIYSEHPDDLNRAICECVAKMQSTSDSASTPAVECTKRP